MVERSKFVTFLQVSRGQGQWLRLRKVIVQFSTFICHFFVAHFSSHFFVLISRPPVFSFDLQPVIGNGKSLDRFTRDSRTQRCGPRNSETSAFEYRQNNIEETSSWPDNVQIRYHSIQWHGFNFGHGQVSDSKCERSDQTYFATDSQTIKELGIIFANGESQKERRSFFFDKL